MENLFGNLFNNLDLTDLSKKLEAFKTLANDKYNTFMDNNFRKYDLTTEDGYKEFINEAANIRTKLVESKNNPFAGTMINVLDNLVKNAMEYHSEHTVSNEKKNDPVKDIVNNEVNRQKTENHGKLNVNTKTDLPEDFEYPSNKLNYRQTRNVWKLVDEYMDTMIQPYLPKDVDDEVVDDMASGLFEFAAWILTKEEE